MELFLETLMYVCLTVPTAAIIMCYNQLHR